MLTQLSRFGITIRHTLYRTEWNAAHSIQLVSNLLGLVLPVLLPNSVTCKFHGIHYRQFPLLANSTTVTFTANFHYLQIQRPLKMHQNMYFVNFQNFSVDGFLFMGCKNAHFCITYVRDIQKPFPQT